jgi:hypothetical protein
MHQPPESHADLPQSRKGRKVAQRGMGDREKSCFALRSFAAFAAFAVRYWQFHSLPHPVAAGSAVSKENWKRG